MHDTLPLLDKIQFPAIRRGKLETLQINVGYRCNQSCIHCHVNAGPTRTEEMTSEIAHLAVEFLRRQKVAILDITGGAPELNEAVASDAIQFHAGRIGGAWPSVKP